MLLKPFFKVNITLISEPGKENSHTHTHTHYKSTSLMNSEINILNKILAN